MAENKIKFLVRQMQVSDIAGVVHIWEVAHFWQATYTKIYLYIDPDGVFVAQDIVSGKIIGVIHGINLSQDFAYVSAYAVLSEYQGKGIGTALWEAMMKHIGTERNISLFSGPEMLSKYRDRKNFVVIPEKRALTFIGKFYSNQLIQGIDGISVLPISEDNIEKVIQYDREVCGVDRSPFIRELSKVNEYVNRVALNEKDQVVGFCVICICYPFNKGMVEPLYADDEKIAELLVAKCCQSLALTETNGVRFQCWDVNHNAIEIAKKIGLKLKDSVPILFTKKVVEGNMDKISCLSSRGFFPF